MTSPPFCIISLITSINRFHNTQNEMKYSTSRYSKFMTLSIPADWVCPQQVHLICVSRGKPGKAARPEPCVKFPLSAIPGTKKKAANGMFFTISMVWIAFVSSSGSLDNKRCHNRIPVHVEPLTRIQHKADFFCCELVGGSWPLHQWADWLSLFQ